MIGINNRDARRESNEGIQTHEVPHETASTPDGHHAGGRRHGRHRTACATRPLCSASGAIQPGPRCVPQGLYRTPRFGGPNDTPGWPMMAPQERQAHHEHMAGFKTYEECRAYIDQHHQEMRARAKERGLAMPAKPPRDACLWLKAKARPPAKAQRKASGA